MKLRNTVYVNQENGDTLTVLAGDDEEDYPSDVIDAIREGNPDAFVDPSETDDFDSAGAKVDEVLAWVDAADDIYARRDRAMRAQANEGDREGGPRQGLLKRLDKVVADADAAEQAGQTE